MIIIHFRQFVLRLGPPTAHLTLVPSWYHVLPLSVTNHKYHVCDAAYHRGYIHRRVKVSCNEWVRVRKGYTFYMGFFLPLPFVAGNLHPLL